MSLHFTAEELLSFMEGVFPQVQGLYEIEMLSEQEVHVRLKVSDMHLRPGGTVSGPSMFSLADISAYLMVLAHIGPEALAVTTNCSIDFMRKPEAGQDLISRCSLLKLGKVLAVTDVHIFSQGEDRPVARASLTYSIPKKGS